MTEVNTLLNPKPFMGRLISDIFNGVEGNGGARSRLGSLPAYDTGTTLAALQDVIDASASNIAILDRNSRILFVNRAWRQFATRTGSLIDQFGIGDRYPGVCLGTVATSVADATVIAKGIESVIANNEIVFQIEYQCTALAEPVWFRLHAESFILPGFGGEWVVMASHDDITSEKLAKATLLEDRERLWETANIIPWEADPVTREFTVVGDQAETMLGYPVKRWFESNFWVDHIHSADRERAIEQCTALMKSEDKFQFEYRMIAKDGRVVSINQIVSVHREYGEPVRLRGFMVDITERRQTEDTLRLLSGRFINSQEEERKRIARDLHDDLNQRMALLSIELEQVGQIIGKGSEGVIQRIKDLQLKVLGISTEIHRMSYSLHPAKLDHLGLFPALKSFCGELSQSRGVNIQLQQRGFPANLPTDTTLCVFRIAQEGLQNAAKHSGAEKVDVSLIKTAEAVALIISDRGCGFDMTTDNMSKGLGFTSMRERLRLVNGEMTIQSKPNKGTRISVKVPLKNGVMLQPATRSEEQPQR